MWSSSISVILPFAFLSPVFNNKQQVHSPLRHGESCQKTLTSLTTSTVSKSFHHNHFQHIQHIHLQSNKINHLLNDEPKSSHSNSNKYMGIRKGKIHIEHNFITPSEVTALQKDIAQLKKDSHQFQPSGLSNRVPGDQNTFGKSDRLTCTITPDLLKGESQYSYIRSLVEDKLDALKHDLQLALLPSHMHIGESIDHDDAKLNEESLMEGLHVQLKLAEMYYSISPRGSSLPRHNDERHEDTKGDKGWIHDTRRSISWLIYLNDGWGIRSGVSTIVSSDTNCEGREPSGYGGELRAYCRKCCSNVQCGSHDGNMQVGWLRLQRTQNLNEDEIAIEEDFEPIFLDSWVKTLSEEEDYDGDEYEKLKWRPMSALYRIKRDNLTKPEPYKNDFDRGQSHNQQYPQREYLSKPFGPDSPSWPSEINLNPSEFVKALASQLSDEDLQRRFIGTEDVQDPDINIVDVVPSAGTLVLFDSVVVSHEVLEVTSGERLAVAGWFHEIQQPFPDWYGT
jgi:hypothetical protein